MKSILVIGLGRFGKHLTRNLVELGNEVMVVDIDEENLVELLPIATRPVTQAAEVAVKSALVKPTETLSRLDIGKVKSNAPIEITSKYPKAII